MRGDPPHPPAPAPAPAALRPSPASRPQAAPCFSSPLTREWFSPPQPVGSGPAHGKAAEAKAAAAEALVDRDALNRRLVDEVEALRTAAAASNALLADMARVLCRSRSRRRSRRGSGGSSGGIGIKVGGERLVESVLSPHAEAPCTQGSSSSGGCRTPPDGESLQPTPRASGRGSPLIPPTPSLAPAPHPCPAQHVQSDAWPGDRADTSSSAVAAAATILPRLVSVPSPYRHAGGQAGAFLDCEADAARREDGGPARPGVVWAKTRTAERSSSAAKQEGASARQGGSDRRCQWVQLPPYDDGAGPCSVGEPARHDGPAWWQGGGSCPQRNGGRSSGVTGAESGCAERLP